MTFIEKCITSFQNGDESFVSTGRLPPAADVLRLIERTHSRYAFAPRLNAAGNGVKG